MRVCIIYLYTVLLLPIFHYGQQSLELLDSLTLLHTRSFTDLDSALQHPDAVYKLVLKKKRYKSFPKEILQFKNLQYLDISKNNIKEIPNEIANLSLLQYFACSKCNLSKFPKGITQLPHLYYLNLNQNNIDSIPDEIERLSNLQILDLWDNNLSHFPQTMSELKSLRLMDLRSILLNQEQQNYIQSLLPYTKIYFSPACKCSW